MRILTAAGNGNGTGVRVNIGGKNAKENLRTAYCWGTFDGAAVTMEISLDDSTYFPITDISFSAKGATNLEARTVWLRGVVTGGGGSVSINLSVH